MATSLQFIFKCRINISLAYSLCRIHSFSQLLLPPQNIWNPFCITRYTTLYCLSLFIFLTTSSISTVFSILFSFLGMFVTLLYSRCHSPIFLVAFSISNPRLNCFTLFCQFFGEYLLFIKISRNLIRRVMPNLPSPFYRIENKPSHQHQLVGL